MSFALYIDEDRISAELISGLRTSGFDVLTCLESKMLGRRDEEHLEFATSQSRVLYSANVRDYARIHKQWMVVGTSHAGIVVCNTQFWSVGEQIRRLVLVSSSLSAEDVANSIVHLSGFS